MTVKTLPIILGGLLVLGACGQKGPLYLEKSEAELAAEANAGESAAQSAEETDGAAVDSEEKE